MRFGLGIPTCREGSPYPLGFATPELLKESARFAEAAGYYSVWGDDHLASTPGQLEGLSAIPNYYEPLATFAYLAALTTRLRLMTATLVPALREPVLLAKQVAAIDRLSGGRLILGLGLGGQRDEFEALAADPKANRGKMLDEFVEALRQLLETQRGPFTGRYYRFGEIGVGPAPLQRPFPIYLSGQVEDAIERAGAVANGWIVSSATPEQVAERTAILHRAAEAAGRGRDAVEVCLFIHLSIGSTREAAQAAWDASYGSGQTTRRPKPAPAPGSAAAAQPSMGRSRTNLLGSPEEIRERLAEYARAGVQHVGLVFHAQTGEELLDQAGLFAREVMPSFAEDDGRVR